MGFSGDLRNLPVLGLDIGLGELVSVNLGEFRAWYFTVRGARPILIENIEENELLDENIEENELLDAATGGNVYPCVNPRNAGRAPADIDYWRRRSETAPVGPDRCPTMHSGGPEAPCAA